MRFLTFFTLLLMIPLLLVAGEKNARFLNETDALLTQIVSDGLVDYDKLNSMLKPQLNSLANQISTMPESELANANVRKAFLINAYNILTLSGIVANMPINSPQDVGGFFDRHKYSVAGEQLTLNDLENKKIREPYGDARIHFVLVCAAKGCPILIPEAYRPETLDKQLERQTRQALNDPLHVEVDAAAKEVKVSELFKWYKQDFTTDGKSILDYVNLFRNKTIPADYSVSYKTYNWALNNLSMKKEATGATDVSLQAYTPSTLLRPGQLEVKVFNNLYTQTSFFDGDRNETDQNSRSSFFSGITTIFYGLTPRINIGMDVYVRSVRNDDDGSSPFALFKFDSDQNSRTALTQIGPKVKVTPFSNLPSLTFQTTALFALPSNLDGADASQSQPFLDFDGIQWFNQIFYDRSLSDNTLIYFEGGFFVRFDSEFEDFFTPLKAIFNYFPSDKVTLYLPTEFTSFWQEGSVNGYYAQFGLGAKYQLTSNLEIEGLFTDFSLGKNQGAGQTFNLGFRFIR
ncbi:MAG: DUF547 domain-containing protein [Calditrichia bacterium]